MKYILLVIVVSIIGLAGCADMPTGPSAATLRVTPSAPQQWLYTNPQFVASGGDRTYFWRLDSGEGNLVPGTDSSRVEFFPSIHAKMPMNFSITVSSAGQRVTVTGTILAEFCERNPCTDMG